jgi:hypothetical protein
LGIEFVCWKDCPLQKRLGLEAFRSAMKLPAYKQLAERLAPDRLTTLELRIRTGEQAPRVMAYQEICERIDAIAGETPDCASCLRSCGRENGCLHSVSYPIDEPFEQLAFKYFARQIPIENSVCQQIYRDVISGLPSEGLAWHPKHDPSSNPKLTVLPRELREFLPQPISYELGSSQMLEALFRSPDGTAEIVAFGVFWHEFSVAAQGMANRDSSVTISEALGLDRFFKLAVIEALGTGCQVIVDR